jgi:hypothetical protein
MCKTSRAAWCLLASLTLAACSSPPPKGDQPSGDNPFSVTAARVAEPSPTAVTLTPVKWPELQAAIASQKGKVVLLDVWGEF